MKNNEKNNSPAYSGALDTPVVFADPPLAAQVLGADHPDVEPAILEESGRVTQELLGKLPLLLDHFGVSRSAPDKWLQLSYRLARAHVPGFQTVSPKKSGAPQDWGPLELSALYLEVQILTKRGMTAMDACRALVRLKDGTWRFPRSRDAKTLYRRYQEARKSLSTTMATLSPSGEMQEALDGAIQQRAAEGWVPKDMP